MNSIVNIEESFEVVNNKLTDLGYVIKHNPTENVYLISSENVDDNYTGYILEKESNKIVCYGQKKVVDIDQDKFNNLLNENEHDGKTVVKMEYCEDGTLMRLYYHNDKWYTSTTNCTDAKMSFWSSQNSFDTMFWEIFNERCSVDLLDKESTYYFILINNENRLVIKHKINSLVYLYKMNKSGENYSNVFNKGVFWRPVLVKDLDTSDINSCFWNKKRGIVIKFKGDENVYKMDFDSYKNIKTVRGNNPNIEMRYIELINDEPSRKLLQMYYSEYNSLFKKIHKLYNDFIYHIYQLYLESHVHHTKKIDKSHVYFPLIKSLHFQYKKTNKAIIYNDVKIRIGNMHVNIINDLFKKLEVPN
jgi:hypothetical protein